MNLAMDRVASNRNFANKIWNAARFLIGNLEGEYPTGALPTDDLSLPDQWILSRLNTLIGQVIDSLRLTNTVRQGGKSMISCGGNMRLVY